jgi:hypothetical protein
VFTRARHHADRLARQIGKPGVGAVALHGGRSQNQRTRALAAFAMGRAHALVATDVAARGIQIDELATETLRDMTQATVHPGRTHGDEAILLRHAKGTDSIPLHHVISIKNSVECASCAPRRSWRRSAGRPGPLLPGRAWRPRRCSRFCAGRETSRKATAVASATGPVALELPIWTGAGDLSWVRRARS